RYRRRKTMRALLLRLCASLALVSSAHADDKELREKIVGSWKLVSVVYEDQESKARTPVLGEHPRGRQIATADGLWLALGTRAGAQHPQDGGGARAGVAPHDPLTGPLRGRGRQGDHQGRGRLEGGLGRRRADAFHPLRGRPPVHREPADAASQPEQQGGAG